MSEPRTPWQANEALEPTLWSKQKVDPMSNTTLGATRPQALFSIASPSKDLPPQASDFIVSTALRFLSFACGASILSASCLSVIASAKLTSPDAFLVAALSAGVACASLAIPRARSGLAVAIIVALISGEAFNLLSSAERIITAREAAAATIGGANDRRAAAEARLRNAELARDRLAGEARTTVMQPGCGVQCRTLLQAQGDKLDSEVTISRVALEQVPAERSATPLADRLGVKPWVLDMTAAALLSVGANGLAAVLIAFGARPGLRCSPEHRDYRLTPAMAAVPARRDTPLAANGTRADDEPPQPPKGGLPIPVTPRTRGLLTLIEGHGGMITGSQRDLAHRAGLSKTALGRALADLSKAGIVEIAADRLTGTVVRLRAA